MVYKEKQLADESRIEAERVDVDRETRRRKEMLQAARRERWEMRRKVFEVHLANDGNGLIYTICIIVIAVGIIVGHLIRLNGEVEDAKKWHGAAACFNGCTAQGPTCGKTIKVSVEKEACFCQRETCGTWAVPTER